MRGYTPQMDPNNGSKRPYFTVEHDEPMDSKDLLGQPPLGVSMLLARALEDFKASEAAAQKHLAQLLSQLPVVPVEGEDVCEDLLEKGDH